MIELRHIEKTISENILKDLILSENLSGRDTIVLNSNEFDAVVLEYREQYGESLKIPHLLLNVLIREADYDEIPRNRIGIIRNDEFSIRKANDKQPSKYYPHEGEIIYRCGYCGNIVDSKGKELIRYDWDRAKYLLENFQEVIRKHVSGECCVNSKLL